MTLLWEKIDHERNIEEPGANSFSFSQLILAKHTFWQKHIFAKRQHVKQMLL